MYCSETQRRVRKTGYNVDATTTNAEGFNHAHFYAWINILICFPREETRLTPADPPKRLLYIARDADAAGCSGRAIFLGDYSWCISIATWFLDLSTPAATKITSEQNTVPLSFISLLNATVVDGFNFLDKLPPGEKTYYARSSSTSKMFNFFHENERACFRVQTLFCVLILVTSMKCQYCFNNKEL